MRFAPESAIDPVYFEDTYYLGAGKNRDRGYRVLVQALQKTCRIAVGHVHLARQDDSDRDPGAPRWAFPPAAYFANEVHNATEIDRGTEPKIRSERTLAERLISELSETEFHPEKYEDEYRRCLLKAIEQNYTRLTAVMWVLDLWPGGRGHADAPSAPAPALGGTWPHAPQFQRRGSTA